MFVLDVSARPLKRVRDAHRAESLVILTSCERSICIYISAIEGRFSLLFYHGHLIPIYLNANQMNLTIWLSPKHANVCFFVGY